MPRSFLVTACAAVALPWLVVKAPADPSGDRTSERAAAPAPAPEFLLESTKGERVSLCAERPGRVASAVVFLAQDCPVSKLYAPQVGKLAKEYSEQGIAFFVVDSTASSDANQSREMAKLTGTELLLDPMRAVAGRFEVGRAATALLFDQSFKLVYRGAIDDQHTLAKGAAESKGHASHEWLVEAIEALLADGEVAEPKTEGSGVELASAPLATVTFNDQVAPILYANCSGCHRPGQVGPMALLDYDDAKGYAPQIAEVIGQGRMPPWHADPRYGHFENEKRLTETEKAILAQWAETGAKEGSSKSKPIPPTFADEGWAAGKPDLIVELPKPQDIPADGVVDYRYVLVDPKVQEDLWVQSVEIRPTAQDATHHVLALYLPPGKGEMELARGLQDGGLIGAGYFGVQVPGCRPNIYPDGAGKKIEKGARFLFQLHYTPNGKATKDRTRMGLRFCKEPPKEEVKTRGVFSFKLRIPPNEPHAVATSEWTFKKPTRLISMFPHMHMRGAAFRFEKLVGEGEDVERTILCDVPKYDFNWQNFYLPTEPPRFEPGDKIFCTAVYDNSKGNPFNPDPNRTVTWGDQTFEEMMIGYIDYIEE